MRMAVAVDDLLEKQAFSTIFGTSAKERFSPERGAAKAACVRRTGVAPQPVFHLSTRELTIRPLAARPMYQRAHEGFEM